MKVYDATEMMCMHHWLGSSSRDMAGKRAVCLFSAIESNRLTWDGIRCALGRIMNKMRCPRQTRLCSNSLAFFLQACGRFASLDNAAAIPLPAPSGDQLEKLFVSFAQASGRPMLVDIASVENGDSMTGDYLATVIE